MNCDHGNQNDNCVLCARNDAIDEAMAARDGLAIWKRRAEEAEAKVSREAELQAIISDTAAVLVELAPSACGTLAERVRAVADRVVELEAHLESCGDCYECAVESGVRPDGLSRE